jgi:hypothetical protein
MNANVCPLIRSRLLPAMVFVTSPALETVDDHRELRRSGFGDGQAILHNLERANVAELRRHHCQSSSPGQPPALLSAAESVLGSLP